MDRQIPTGPEQSNASLYAYVCKGVPGAIWTED